MIRAVLDTNVLISGLLWTGTPANLLKLVDRRQLAICVNEAILSELGEVLQRKKFKARLKQLGFNPAELVSIVAERSLLFENVSLPFSVVEDDPDDDNVLACALAAKARYIVTGDTHLLKLSKFRNVQILSPAGALKLFQP